MQLFHIQHFHTTVTLSHTTWPHTTFSHTTRSHKTLSHTTLSHTTLAYHTQLCASRGTCGTGLGQVARLVAVAPRHCLWQGWLPAATPSRASSSAQKPAWLPDHTPGSVQSASSRSGSRTPHCAAVHDVPSRRRFGSSSVAGDSLPSGSAGAGSSSAARTAPVGTDDFEWTCRICSLELRDPNKQRLSKLCTGHIAFRHKG